MERIWCRGQIGMDAMRTHKTLILTTLYTLVAGSASAQNAGPSPDESVRPIASTTASTTQGSRSDASNETFSAEEIGQAAGTFFGKTSGAMGTVVERVFRDQGRPMGYIRGEEIAGAIGVGLRYGKGTLVMKDGQERPVFWQGDRKSVV